MKKQSVIYILAGLIIASLASHASAADNMGVDIHGFISQGYVKTTDNNFIADSTDGTFKFNEMGINFGKNLTDRLRLSTQFFARNFGEMGNNDIKLDYAYGDYRFKDWLGVRFGLLKAPHGLYNETRDIDMLRNSIFLPQSVYEEVVRSPMLNLQGAGLYGFLPMGAAGGLSYQVLYGVQNVDQDSRMAQALVGYPANFIENDSTKVDDKIASSLVWNTPLTGLRLGASYNNAEMDLQGHFSRDLIVGIGPDGPIVIDEGSESTIEFEKYENIVYSLEYTWQNLMVVAEYIDVSREFTLTLPNPMAPGETTSEEGTFDPYGWYFGAAYRFTDWFELGGYYSESQGNSKAGDMVRNFDDYYDYLKDYCVTFLFDINPFWVFKLEYHNLEGSYSLNAWDNPVPEDPDNPYADFFEKDWSMIAAKVTVSF